MKIFHGINKKKSFFEGWYLKHQNACHTISFIPAFHIDEKGLKSASIQIITDSVSHNVIYPAETFTLNENEFFVKIDNNIFSRNGISINIKSENFTVKGNLKYDLFTPPKYDIMGPFHLIKNMQCNHGVLSLGHTLHGSLIVNGENINFDNGVGYIEKDWGSSFPNNYLWSQCNYFNIKNSCIMVSIAHIPFLGLSFTGCICCIYYGGKEYRLATYNGVNIIKYSNNEVILKQKNYLLKVNILDGKFHSLLAPNKGGMTRTIHESAACKVRYRFYINKNQLFDLISEKAGFEYSDINNINVSCPQSSAFLF